jgi:hypothetical protein
MIMSDVVRKAREFINRNARPLDLARWHFHFESGSKQEVLNALSFYQNDDGGLGHALEPDSWNPFSSPIQTWAATEILQEISFSDRSHPLIKGILRYLESGTDFDGHCWRNTIQSNNDYPHAPWWHTGSVSTSHHDYNPTACLAGFILKHADKNSTLFTLAHQIAGEAFDAIMSRETLKDMHALLCYIRLMQYAQEAETAPFDINALKGKLLEQVTNCISRDISAWDTSYVCKPSQFLVSKDSIFYAGVQGMADYECEHIVQAQLEDGSWPIPWGWADFPEAWAISKNWWKSDIIIKNIRYLAGVRDL